MRWSKQEVNCPWCGDVPIADCRDPETHQRTLIPAELDYIVGDLRGELEQKNGLLDHFRVSYGIQQHLIEQSAQRAARAATMLAEAVGAVWESMRLGEDIEVVQGYLEAILMDPGVAYYLALHQEDNDESR